MPLFATLSVIRSLMADTERREHKHKDKTRSKDKDRERRHKDDDEHKSKKRHHKREEHKDEDRKRHKKRHRHDKDTAGLKVVDDDEDGDVWVEKDIGQGGNYVCYNLWGMVLGALYAYTSIYPASRDRYPDL